MWKVLHRGNQRDARWRVIYTAAERKAGMRFDALCRRHRGRGGFILLDEAGRTVRRHLA